MALFKETDVSLAVDSDEPHTQKRELASAIEIAELEAGLLGGAGVRIIQHDYWSFSVTPTFDVPFGQKEERREWLALAETARTVAGMGDARSNTMQETVTFTDYQ